MKLTTQTFPTVLVSRRVVTRDACCVTRDQYRDNLGVQGQLEKRLSQRGHFFVGNTLTWADIHLFFFCGTGDFMDSKVS